MIVNELSKKLGIENKELISFFREKGYSSISSHMQKVTDEMVEVSEKHFSNKENKEENIKQEKEITIKEPVVSHKTFKPTDEIPCRSVTPWKLLAVGVDKNTVYSWSGYGDVEYVLYKDLQSMRRKSIVTKPEIIIEDSDLCYLWRNDLGNTYKYFLGVEYPEEFFDLEDAEFKKLLEETTDTLREVIKTTALSMVKNKNYPSVQKLSLIDEVLGTCIKDFL